MNEPVQQPLGWRQPATRLVQATIEAGLLLLVCLSPWAFGGMDEHYEALLDAGVAVLLVLWGLRMLLEWQLSWKKCPIALCLAALLLVGVCQLLPLPHGLLSTLSPATARMYDRFLPSQPEVLPFGEPREVTVPAPGSTLSLYPHDTRRELTRLLAVFLVFVIVRNNVAPVAGLRRLSIAVLVNGVLLSFFGLIQFFSSPPQTIYWTEKVRGTVFGPFVNRDHFAFYVNVCIGLGTGLLLGLYGGTSSTRRRRSARGDASWSGGRGDASPLSLLHDPQALWISLALAVMVAGVALCLSRGGFLALLGGLLVCLTLVFSRSAQFARLQAGLVVVTAALALVAWFGLAQVEKRLSTLWNGEALLDDRISLLLRSPPLIKAFPLWGTGYGTFDYVERLYRTNPRETGWGFQHAHNEYLEALIEGGVVRLLLSVLAIVLVYRLGYRAWHQHQGRPEAALALGALFGFTTLVIHSGFDFGLHIPAIALLAAVLAALLAGLDQDERATAQDTSVASEPPSPPLGEGRGVRGIRGLAPMLATAAFVLLGLWLVSEGWKAKVTYQLRTAASELSKTSTRFSGFERRITYLETAVRLDPSDADLQQRLGQAHLDLFDEEKQRLENGGWLITAAQAVLSSDAEATAGSVLQAGWATVPSWLATAKGRQMDLQQLNEPLARAHQTPGLRHCLAARDLCPLLMKAQLAIAGDVDGLLQGDARARYLERACLLAPTSPGIWYRRGVQALADHHPDLAWNCWRRSLEMSDRYLPNVLTRSTPLLSPGDIVDRVLPDNPAILVAAASNLYPAPAEAPRRRPFLERALVLLQQQPLPLTADDLHLQAVILRSLGQSAQALTAYQSALFLQPEQVAWRYEFARLLYKEGDLQRARHELLTILAQQPGLGEARNLLDVVNHEIAEKL